MYVYDRFDPRKYGYIFFQLVSKRFMFYLINIQVLKDQRVRGFKPDMPTRSYEMPREADQMPLKMDGGKKVKIVIVDFIGI